MKYRKKPVIIEAFQLSTIAMDDSSKWPSWLHLAWNTKGEEGLFLDQMYFEGRSMHNQSFCLRTLEGIRHVQPDDWIIKDIERGFYLCHPNTFKAIYEPILLTSS